MQLFYLLLLLTVSCVSLGGGTNSPAPGQSAISKELDTVSSLAISRESGEALSFVIRARQSYVVFLQSGEKDLDSVLKTLGCSLKAYEALGLPAGAKLVELANQYSASLASCK